MKCRLNQIKFASFSYQKKGFVMTEWLKRKPSENSVENICGGAKFTKKIPKKYYEILLYSYSAYIKSLKFE